jgi:hypothetical protein
MRRIGAKGVALALVVLLLLVSLAVVASAAASQFWYLDSDFHTDIPQHRVMEKTIDAQSGNVTVEAGECMIWLAENAALANVTFPGEAEESAWVTQICTDSDWGFRGSECNVTIGEWDIDADAFFPFDTEPEPMVVWNSGAMMLQVSVQVANATVHKGNYLALEICNDDSIKHLIHTEGCSWLASPCTDPGYPWPEIATGILFGMGLIGLLGYIGVRRVRAGKTAA